jgi:hypothetical protein
MREHTDGGFPFANDFNAIAQALADDAAVLNGCGITDGGSDDMTVDVASGDVRIDGSNYSVGSQQVTLDAADGSNDRYDLIVAGTDGAAEKVTGTASSQPSAPSIPADHALLAIVIVQAGTSGVTDGDINGARGVNAAPKQIDDHASQADAHHPKYTDADARSQAVGMDFITRI